jgi:hypothetical protein
LASAHDFNLVTRAQARGRPCSAWNDHAIDRDGNAARIGRDLFFVQECRERGDSQRLVSLA